MKHDRRGAPRKPEELKKKVACIAIHDEVKEQAKEIGGGNISRGIHIAVKSYAGDEITIKGL